MNNPSLSNDLYFRPAANLMYCLAMVDELSDTFETQFDMWGYANGWEKQACVEESEDGETSSLIERELCLLVQESRKPEVHTLDDESCLLAIPICQDGEVAAIAMKPFPTENQDVLLRLSDHFLRHQNEKQELSQLREENHALVEQISKDFEELMFLRDIAGGLEVSDTSSGLEVIAKRMLELLNDSIHARTIVVLDSIPDKVAAGRVIAWTGQVAPEANTCCHLINDLVEEDRTRPIVKNRIHQSEEAQRYRGVRELVIVPIMTEARLLGWLLAINHQNGGDGFDVNSQFGDLEFGTHEASLMATAASIMATQTTNVQMVREKEELLVRMVRSLVSAVEAKDEYTCGHSERVACYGRALAVSLGYSQEEADRLYLTGLLHDVGKIGVSDATLKKPGRLTEAEFEEIKRHPDEGWAILQGLKPLEYVLPGLLQHHERFDGDGYPDGLAGEEISLDGRILAVADAYDAMTSDRPYRKGMPSEKAESILREGAGTQWDGKVVDAFFDVLDEICQIRDEYRPRERPVRIAGKTYSLGCQMSHVRDEAGQILAWS